MPAGDVRWPVPLTRLNPWYPGQMGVPGTDTETGLRLHSTGTIFYVDPNAVGVSDARDGTNPNDPLLTVATAITKCQDYRGDVIAVMMNGAWQYSANVNYATAIQEEVTLNVAGVRLVGVSYSGAGVIWEPVTAAGAGTCITVTAPDCTIEGFCFQGGTPGGRAIFLNWDPPAYGENCIVRHCLFDEDIDIGIEIEFSWFNHIYDNSFQACDTYGIYAAIGSSGLGYSHIHHNYFLDIATGAITLLGGSNNNNVYENWVYNTDAENGAAATDEGIDTTGGTGNLVHHNTLSCALPGPGAGDFNDFCTAAGTDAWIQNFCLNGPNTLPPT